jgi:long-chain fatty acid transport protein
LIAASSTYATSYEIFADLSYTNPAALNSVKDYEFVIGGAGVFSTFHYSGTAAGVQGTTTSNTSDVLPYGRFAKRFSPKIVASFDISQPIYTNIQYPLNNFANGFATATVMRDTNYSPKLSYQATPQLALGIGFDANDFYNGQLNFAVPPFGNMTNRASSWGYGWDAGLFYVFSPATFLNLSYYSQIIQHASGFSRWGAIQNNSLSADVKLPATTIVNLIHMLSPVWALSGTVRYAQWSTLRYTVLQNNALGVPITVPDHFYNNFSYELATHYQINEKWGVIGAFDYEPNVQPTFTRNI